jgi:hypothetical protein
VITPLGRLVAGAAIAALLAIVPNEVRVVKLRTERPPRRRDARDGA